MSNNYDLINTDSLRTILERLKDGSNSGVEQNALSKLRSNFNQIPKRAQNPEPPDTNYSSRYSRLPPNIPSEEQYTRDNRAVLAPVPPPPSISGVPPPKSISSTAPPPPNIQAAISSSVGSRQSTSIPRQSSSTMPRQSSSTILWEQPALTEEERLQQIIDASGSEYSDANWQDISNLKVKKVPDQKRYTGIPRSMRPGGYNSDNIPEKEVMSSTEESIQQESIPRDIPTLCNREVEEKSASSELTEQECILELFDGQLKSGLVSFMLNGITHHAFFHESVFVSTKMEEVQYQLSPGDKLKFHGTLEKPGHKIGYCASIIWPINSPVKISFMRPQADDVEMYERCIDDMFTLLIKKLRQPAPPPPTGRQLEDHEQRTSRIDDLGQVFSNPERIIPVDVERNDFGDSNRFQNYEGSHSRSQISEEYSNTRRETQPINRYRGRDLESRNESIDRGYNPSQEYTGRHPQSREEYDSRGSNPIDAFAGMGSQPYQGSDFPGRESHPRDLYPERVSHPRGYSSREEQHRFDYPDREIQSQSRDDDMRRRPYPSNDYSMRGGQPSGYPERGLQSRDDYLRRDAQLRGDYPGPSQYREEYSRMSSNSRENIDLHRRLVDSSNPQSYQEMDSNYPRQVYEGSSSRGRDLRAMDQMSRQTPAGRKAYDDLDESRAPNLNKPGGENLKSTLLGLLDDLHEKDTIQAQTRDIQRPRHQGTADVDYRLDIKQEEDRYQGRNIQQEQSGSQRFERYQQDDRLLTSERERGRGQVDIDLRRYQESSSSQYVRDDKASRYDSSVVDGPRRFAQNRENDHFKSDSSSTGMVRDKETVRQQSQPQKSPEPKQVIDEPVKKLLEILQSSSQPAKDISSSDSQQMAKMLSMLLDKAGSSSDKVPEDKDFRKGALEERSVKIEKEETKLGSKRERSGSREKERSRKRSHSKEKRSPSKSEKQSPSIKKGSRRKSKSRSPSTRKSSPNDKESRKRSRRKGSRSPSKEKRRGSSKKRKSRSPKKKKRNRSSTSKSKSPTRDGGKSRKRSRSSRRKRSKSPSKDRKKDRRRDSRSISKDKRKRSVSKDSSNSSRSSSEDGQGKSRSKNRRRRERKKRAKERKRRSSKSEDEMKAERKKKIAALDRSYKNMNSGETSDQLNKQIDGEEKDLQEKLNQIQESKEISRGRDDNVATSSKKYPSRAGRTSTEPQEPVFGKRLSEPPGIPPAPVPAPDPGYYSQPSEPIFGKKMNTNSGSYGEGSGSSSTQGSSEYVQQTAGEYVQQAAGEYVQQAAGEYSQQAAGEYGKQAATHYGQQQTATEYGSLSSVEPGDPGDVMFGRQIPTSKGTTSSKPEDVSSSLSGETSKGQGLKVPSEGQDTTIDSNSGSESEEEGGGQWKPKKHVLKLHENKKPKEKIKISLGFIGKMPSKDTSKKIQRHPPKPPKPAPDIEIVSYAFHSKTSKKGSEVDKKGPDVDRKGSEGSVVKKEAKASIDDDIPEAPAPPIFSETKRMLQKETSNKKQQQQQQNKKQKSSTQESKTSSSSKPASSSSVPTSTKASTPSSDSSFNYSGGQSSSESSNIFLNFVNKNPSAETLKVPDTTFNSMLPGMGVPPPQVGISVPPPSTMVPTPSTMVPPPGIGMLPPGGSGTMPYGPQGMMPPGGPGMMHPSGPGMMYPGGAGMMPPGGPGMMPQRGPGMMPQRGPGMMPHGGPGMMHSGGPGMMPHRGPGMMPQGGPGPGMMPNRGPGPGMMPYGRPDMIGPGGPRMFPPRGPGMMPGGMQGPGPGPRGPGLFGPGSGGPGMMRPGGPRGMGMMNQGGQGYLSSSTSQHAPSTIPMPPVSSQVEVPLFGKRPPGDVKEAEEQPLFGKRPPPTVAQAPQLIKPVPATGQPAVSAASSVDYIKLLDKKVGVKEAFDKFQQKYNVTTKPKFFDNCKYNETSYSLSADFDPRENPVENIVFGDKNVEIMSTLSPVLEAEKKLWSSNPVLYAYTSQMMTRNIQDILFDLLCKLKNEYMSGSTHIYMIVGYAEAPLVKSNDELYHMYLDLVEKAIQFNLEHDTNYSLSFGFIQFHKKVRAFDKTIFTMNQVIQSINHYFLFSKTVGLTSVTLQEQKEGKNSMEINVKGSKLNIRTDKYNEDVNILNNSALMEFSNLLRNHFQERPSMIELISEGKSKAPKGLNRLGSKITLPAPTVPLAMAAKGAGLSDVLVRRMMDRLKGNVSTAIPRPTLNIMMMSVESKK